MKNSFCVLRIRSLSPAIQMFGVGIFSSVNKTILQVCQFSCLASAEHKNLLIRSTPVGVFLSVILITLSN